MEELITVFRQITNNLLEKDPLRLISTFKNCTFLHVELVGLHDAID